MVAQITLDINGTVLRGEEQGSNAMAAVDSVIAVMARRVERYKGPSLQEQTIKEVGRERIHQDPRSACDANGRGGP